MAYVECRQCGKRALSVATRCPHCGQDFPPQPFPGSVPRSDPDRLRRALVVTGGLVAAALAVAVTVLLVDQRAGGRTVTPPPVATGLESPPTPRDSSPLSAPASAGDSVGPSAPPPSTVPPPPPAGQGVQRYATTWVNVRASRSGGAPTVGVLRPGDAVLVDSLRRGWYRVLVDDRTLGYVDRAYLDAVPPPDRP